MSEWISVNDRLPKVGDWKRNHVLTVNDVGRFRVAYYDGVRWRNLKGEGIGWLSPITHWMPLLPPPESEGVCNG